MRNKTDMLDDGSRWCDAQSQPGNTVEEKLLSTLQSWGVRSFQSEQQITGRPEIPISRQHTRLLMVLCDDGLWHAASFGYGSRKRLRATCERFGYKAETAAIAYWMAELDTQRLRRRIALRSLTGALTSIRTCRERISDLRERLPEP